jgi:hypothetical protein
VNRKSPSRWLLRQNKLAGYVKNLADEAGFFDS